MAKKIAKKKKKASKTSSTTKKKAKKEKPTVKKAAKKTVKKEEIHETEDIVPKTVKKTERLSKEKIEDTIYAVAGETGINIINFLGDKKNISEFIIADKLKLDMQTVRNTLYKLHTHNVATYIRKKDRQKGWYISYWTYNKKRIRELIDQMKKFQLEKLKERLHKEEQGKGLFFICSKACARLDFDQATEFEFKCPECGMLMHQQENSRTIEHLKDKIKELEATM